MKDKPKILVVDDEPVNVKLLEAYLLLGNYEVKTVLSGEEALQVVANNDIDLILLDVMMPGIDGFEVTRRLRVDEKTQLIPVVLVTSLRETEDRIKGIKAGCDDFLSKPFDRLELMARVQSLLKVKAYNDHMRDYKKELEAEVARRTVELRQALKRIDDASLETIHRLSMASEYRDEETGGHIQRMSQYSAVIARGMGLDEAVVKSILYAAPMHDVGKIGIPDRILLKSGKLELQEREVMKQHTIIGSKILKGSETEFIKLAETIALTHHEKWDGSGYPKGLKGLEIPLAGRITAIADVFDALISERPYKKGFSIEESFNIIRGGRGIDFDPEVTDAFFAVKDEILAIKDRYKNRQESKLFIIGKEG